MTTITLERAFMIRVLEQLDVAQSLLERSQHHAKIAAMYEELRAALSAPATAPAQPEIVDLLAEMYELILANKVVLAEKSGGVWTWPDRAIEAVRKHRSGPAQPERKPKPFIGTRSAIYKCTDCGHEQSVQEIHTEYGVYVGSGANWCDKCGDGKPERKETP